MPLRPCSLGVALALVVALGCRERQETQIFVVVLPEGFSTSDVDAGASAEVLGTLVVEARAFDTTPPCESRASAESTASVSVDSLHVGGASVHTVDVAVPDDRPFWVTTWGKVGGRDRARRSFLVRPVLGAVRVLCVAVAPSRDDCQCAVGVDMLPLAGASGVDDAIAACETLSRTGAIEPGVSAPDACASFSVEQCLGTTAVSDGGRSGACEMPDGGRDAGASDARASDAASGG